MAQRIVPCLFGELIFSSLIFPSFQALYCDILVLARLPAFAGLPSFLPRLQNNLRHVQSADLFFGRRAKRLSDLVCAHCCRFFDVELGVNRSFASLLRAASCLFSSLDDLCFLRGCFFPFLRCPGNPFTPRPPPNRSYFFPPS